MSLRTVAGALAGTATDFLAIGLASGPDWVGAGVSIVNLGAGAGAASVSLGTGAGALAGTATDFLAIGLASGGCIGNLPGDRTTL